jgi:DNA polymerase-3 subunit chi
VPEVWFYHLQRQGLEQVLPMLLSRALSRQWRCIVQAGSPERVNALDELLWTYSDESFLPHGTKRDGDAERQPVYLTDGDENPNAAVLRILVDGLDPAPATAEAGYERVILVFDGNDEEQLAAARGHWKALKASGAPLSYWQQDEDGRWQKKG